MLATIISEKLSKKIGMILSNSQNLFIAILPSLSTPSLELSTAAPRPSIVSGPQS